MIKIIAVGKIKEKYLIDGINEYSKRMTQFDKITIIETKEITNKTISQNIYEEGEYLLKEINDKDFVITLDLLGNKIDSIALSKKINEIKCYNSTSIVFVIGGSNGLSDDVKKRSNYSLSFSDFTFPHQLMRLILIEQIYRAYTIIYNQEYHK